MARNGHAAALAVEKAIDEVKVARAATASANRQLTGQMRFSASGERRAFFMTRVKPFDGTQAPKSIRQAIEANHRRRRKRV